MNATSPSDTPALTPPSGVIPNFVDPYSLSSAFVATAVLCLPLATIAVIVRLTTSLRGSDRRFRVEDFTCIISWLGLLMTCVFTIFEICHGLGRHQWDVRKADLMPILKLFYINRIFYSPTILAAKITILLQIMRIFVPTKRGLVYWIVQALTWSNICFYSANVLSVIFQCHPVRKAWMTSIPGTCVQTNLNLVITGSINVVSDIMILMLPLWIIWHLKMPIRAKFSVSAVFGVGILANLAGIMRLVFSIRIIHGKDLTYLRLQHGMLTIAEITTAIICASLPLVPQFIALFRCDQSKSTARSRGSKHHDRSESAGSLRRVSDSLELGVRQARLSFESGGYGEAGHSSGSKAKDRVVVTGQYVSAEDDL